MKIFDNGSETKDKFFEDNFKKKKNPTSIFVKFNNKNINNNNNNNNKYNNNYNNNDKNKYQLGTNNIKLKKKKKI